MGIQKYISTALSWLCKIAKDNYYGEPDCRGTLLYWLGKIPEPRFGESKEITDLINREFVLINSPKKGDIVTYEAGPIDPFCGEILHVGLIVEETDPPIVKSKMGTRGSITEMPQNKIMEALDDERYWRYGVDYIVKYYTKKL